MAKENALFTLSNKIFDQEHRIVYRVSTEGFGDGCVIRLPTQ